jgi:integrase/recombinase XerD
MPLRRQAKVLTKGQLDAALGYLDKTRHPTRNRVILLLSVKAGLRAKEIAALTWGMVTDVDGKVGPAIHLLDVASKGRSGRIIPLNGALKQALTAWSDESRQRSDHVVSTERASRTSAQAIVNLFARWYEELGYFGASSHSGRRTFITNAARKIPGVGGSIRDVQLLAGHSSLRTTQGYIEADAEAQRKVVQLV